MNIRRKASILLALLGWTVSVAGVAAAEEWKFTSLDWEPYSGKELADQGSSVVLLKQKLEQALGVTVTVEFYPWKRAQALAKTQDYVGYFPAWPEEVQEGFAASPAVDRSKIAVLAMEASQLAPTSLDALFAEHKVGLVETYVYPDEVEAAKKAHPGQVDLSPDEAALVRKLAAGRLSAAITDPEVMRFVGAKEGVSGIAVVQILQEKDLVISLRDDAENRPRIERIREALK
jgi:polar amino acid transport system substrate-binding protein